MTVQQYANELYRVAHIGQKWQDRGALLVVFVKNRTIRIVTGNGLQSTLTDTDCGRIISDHIKPKFRAGDYDEGLKDGVEAILNTIKAGGKG